MRCLTGDLLDQRGKMGEMRGRSGYYEATDRPMRFIKHLQKFLIKKYHDLAFNKRSQITLAERGGSYVDGLMLMQTYVCLWGDGNCVKAYFCSF